jgi:hypothetical protein
MQALARLLALVTLSLTFAVATARDVYKWTDANGKVHYGDRTAAGGSTAEKMEIKAKAPQADSGSIEHDERTRRLLNQYQDEQAEADTAKAEKEKNEANRKHNCQVARDLLQKYRTAAYLYDKDKNGERVVLSDEQRAKAEADTQKEVDKWCKPLS